MAIRVLTGLMLGVVHAGFAFAQQPDEMPPLSLAAPPKVPSVSVMPGVVVSQALQGPVEVPPAPLPIPVAPRVSPPSATPVAADPPAGAIRWWGRAEYLIWWPKQQPLIPLLTGNNRLLPDIGTPGTSVLIGNSNVDPVNVPGGKFSAGIELGGPNRLGIETNYFFLGTQTRIYTSAGFTPELWRFLGVPFLDLDSGQEQSFPLRQFESDGALQAQTSTRVAGWEALVTMNLFEMAGFRLQALAGYRDFLANEGLRIDVAGNRFVFDPVNFATLAERYVRTDEVLTSNVFRGGTLGTRTNIDIGPVFVEVDSKLSFGNVRQVVQRNGTTITNREGTPDPIRTSNALFVQSSNTGTFENNQYAVMPEAGMKLGFTYRAAKLFFGYNVLYLNQAVRPSDQLDRTVDLFNSATSNRPSPAIVVSDFWVQGVSFGFEMKY
jgi:hypothetical protein